MFVQKIKFWSPLENVKLAKVIPILTKYRDLASQILAIFLCFSISKWMENVKFAPTTHILMKLGKHVNLTHAWRIKF
jgi:hypothetical protein